MAPLQCCLPSRVTSSVVTDLLGASGRRILQATADGETNPERLAGLGDDHLKCSKEELADALTGSVEPVHRELLKLYLERLAMLDQQIAKLDQLMAAALKTALLAKASLQRRYLGRCQSPRSTPLENFTRRRSLRRTRGRNDPTSQETSCPKDASGPSQSGLYRYHPALSCRTRTGMTFRGVASPPAVPLSHPPFI